MTYYIHETPGRLRIRTPLIKDNDNQAAAAVRVFSGLRGIRRVLSNPATGSITVHFHPQLVCPSSVINLLARHGFIEGVVGFPRRAPMRVPVKPLLTAAAPKPALVPVVRREAPQFDLSRQLVAPAAKKALIVAAKFVLPILAERAFGRPGRAIVSAFL